MSTIDANSIAVIPRAPSTSREDLRLNLLANYFRLNVLAYYFSRVASPSFKKSMGSGVIYPKNYLLALALFVPSNVAFL